MKLCHLKDDSKTSTRAVRQNASVVRTLFDLLIVDELTENEKQRLHDTFSVFMKIQNVTLITL